MTGHLGEGDSYLGSEVAEPDRDDVPNLDRVERLPDASYLVHHDEAERSHPEVAAVHGEARAPRSRR